MPRRVRLPLQRLPVQQLEPGEEASERRADRHGEKSPADAKELLEDGILGELEQEEEEAIAEGSKRLLQHNRLPGLSVYEEHVPPVGLLQPRKDPSSSARDLLPCQHAGVDVKVGGGGGVVWVLGEGGEGELLVLNDGHEEMGGRRLIIESAGEEGEADLNLRERAVRDRIRRGEQEEERSRGGEKQEEERSRKRREAEEEEEESPALQPGSSEQDMHR
eukprot:768699-Hanusia_phi.AAC.2